MSVNLDIRQVGGVTVIDVSGRLTLGEGAGAIREEIDELITAGKTKILMNLSAVSYIDSSGIGELLADFMSAKNAGGALKLMGLTKSARELLRITKLSGMFEIHEDEAEAVRSFA